MDPACETWQLSGDFLEKGLPRNTIERIFEVDLEQGLGVVVLELSSQSPDGQRHRSSAFPAPDAHLVRREKATQLVLGGGM